MTAGSEVGARGGTTAECCLDAALCCIAPVCVSVACWLACKEEHRTGKLSDTTRGAAPFATACEPIVCHTWHIFLADRLCKQGLHP